MNTIAKIGFAGGALLLASTEFAPAQNMAPVSPTPGGAPPMSVTPTVPPPPQISETPQEMQEQGIVPGQPGVSGAAPCRELDQNQPDLDQNPGMAANSEEATLCARLLLSRCYYSALRAASAELSKRSPSSCSRSHLTR